MRFELSSTRLFEGLHDMLACWIYLKYRDECRVLPFSKLLSDSFCTPETAGTSNAAIIASMRTKMKLLPI